MKQIGILLFIFSFLVCATSFADVLAVDFSSIHGNVFVRKNSADDDSYRVAKAKDRFFTGDRVIVQNDSEAVLNFARHGMMVLKSETVMTFARNAGNEIKYGLLSGDAWLNLKNAVRNGFVWIEMSRAAVKVNKGSVTLSVSPDGSDNCIRILSGEAEVVVKGKSKSSVLKAGQCMMLNQKSVGSIIDVFDIKKEEERWRSDPVKADLKQDSSESIQEVNKEQKPIETAERLEKGLDDAYAVSYEIRLSISKGVDGKSQDWFADSHETMLICKNALMKISASISEEKILHPEDKKLSELAVKAGRYVGETERIIEALKIAEIDSDVLTYLRDLQDNISINMETIVDAIEKYRTSGTATLIEKQNKRREHLRIFNTYNSIKREYNKAERLCRKVLRESLPSMYKTREIKEIESLWREIEIDFTRLDEESGSLYQIMNE